MLLAPMASGATPALAALAKAEVTHTVHRYEHDPAVTAFGEEVVQALGVDSGLVFKTLVAQLDTGELVVGVVPVAAQLDLKALAQSLGGKRAAMAPVALAEKSSGYVVGGISPIGQRRALRTVVDESATRLSRVFVSAGRRGIQIEIAPADLIAVTRARCAAIATGMPS